MSKLSFEYNNIPQSNSFRLTEATMKKFEAEKNEKFKDFIFRINACNGYYRVTGVNHEEQNFSGNLVAAVELLAEIDHTLPKGIL